MRRNRGVIRRVDDDRLFAVVAGRLHGGAQLLQLRRRLRRGRPGVHAGHAAGEHRVAFGVATFLAAHDRLHVVVLVDRGQDDLAKLDVVERRLAAVEACQCDEAVRILLLDVDVRRFLQQRDQVWQHLLPPIDLTGL